MIWALLLIWVVGLIPSGAILLVFEMAAKVGLIRNNAELALLTASWPVLVMILISKAIQSAWRRR